MGDFSSLQDIPGMYRYCSSTEQGNLTVFNFVAGHLLNLDGMSDVRDHHDTQKSHTTPPRHHQHVKVVGVLAFALTPAPKTIFQFNPAEYVIDDRYFFDFTSDIFHPPSV